MSQAGGAGWRAEFHHLPPARCFGCSWFRTRPDPAAAAVWHTRESKTSPGYPQMPLWLQKHQREMGRGAGHENKKFLQHAAFWGGEIQAAQGALKFLFLGAGSPLCCLGLMRRSRNSMAKAVFGIMETWSGFGGKETKAHPVPTFTFHRTRLLQAWALPAVSKRC